jgi:hypothetical protein
MPVQPGEAGIGWRDPNRATLAIDDGDQLQRGQPKQRRLPRKHQVAVPFHRSSEAMVLVGGQSDARHFSGPDVRKVATFQYISLTSQNTLNNAWILFFTQTGRRVMVLAFLW